jgi:hypothetical protein
MAIDSRNIDTDLTLELDEDEITVSEFTAALGHFLGLVKEVTRRIAPRRPQNWLIKVYPGSAGIGFYGKPGNFTASEMVSIRNTVLEGITSLENGQRPSVFSDRAIDHARGLSNVFAQRKKPSKIRIWSTNEKSLPVKSAVAQTATRILEAVYEDDGSVEGTLEVLSGHGKFEIVVYDPIDGRAIKCEIPEDGMLTSLQSFMKRVEVFGKVRYRKDGTPVSVRVEKIVPFPMKSDIPSVSDVRGILKVQ